MRRMSLAILVALALLVTSCSDDSQTMNDYLAFCEAQMHLIQADLYALSFTASDADMATASGRNQMSKAFVALRSDGEKLQGYRKVPERAATIDRSIVAIGKDLAYIADEGTSGMNSINGARIQNATSRVQILKNNIAQATTEIDKLKAGR